MYVPEGEKKISSCTISFSINLSCVYISCISENALLKLMKRWLTDLFRSASVSSNIGRNFFLVTHSIFFHHQTDELQTSKVLFIASLCTDPKRLPTTKNFSEEGGDDSGSDDTDDEEREGKEEAFCE